MALCERRTERRCWGTMLERIFHEPKFLVCSLGRLRLLEAGSGTDMTPANRKTRALIGYLSIVAKPVGRERLASLLWGDRGEEQARASLRQAVYELRSLVSGDHLLRVERDTIAAGDDVVSDVGIITAAAGSDNLEQLEKALSEWHGEFFEDLPSIDSSFDAWLQSERVRVPEQLVEAAAEAVKHGMARGEIDSARRIINLLQRRDSMNELVLRLGLQLDQLAGNSAALHRRYERFRELLRAELDTSPAAETQRLFQQLIGASSAPRAAAAPRERYVADQKKQDVKRAPGGSSDDSTRLSIRAGAAPSSKAAAGSFAVYRSLGRSRTIAIAAVMLAVAALGGLVWAIRAPLHAAVPPRRAPLLAVGETRPTGSAYEHYRKGRALLFAQDLGAAGAELEQSVRLEPGFANAWAALATTRWLLASQTRPDSRRSYKRDIALKAIAAAQRALALNSGNAEALGVLALLMPSAHLLDINHRLDRALRSEPDNAQVLGWHAEFLMHVGRNHEALDELKRAYVLGPATPTVATSLALASLKTNRFEEARELMDLVERGRDGRLRDAFVTIHVRYFLYRYDWFGLATWLNALPANASPRMAGFLRLCYDTATALATHQADRFPALRASWRAESADADVDAPVQFLSALGDFDGALAIVEAAERFRRRDDYLTDPPWDAFFTPNLLVLRRDPRVTALFAEWGLSDYWRATGHPPDFMQ